MLGHLVGLHVIEDQRDLPLLHGGRRRLVHVSVGAPGKESNASSVACRNIYAWINTSMQSTTPLEHECEPKPKITTYKQEVSMSCECVSSPSDRTSAHRSPMVCSSRGLASKTAGNWLIHCLGARKNVHNTRLPSRVVTPHQREVSTHLMRWQIWARFTSRLSGGQSL